LVLALTTDRDAAAHPTAIRCQECGRRVTAECPIHGSAQKQPVDADGTPASAPAVPQIPGYEGVTFVARGGFGVVFTARARGALSPVAIKLAREDRAEARRRLAEELRVLTDIGAPHVPAVLGHGETAAGTPYFVMEYLGAATLAARLTDRTVPLPLDMALALATSILLALAAVHERGYVHRDLKPENVFVNGARATLIDFGLVLGGESTSAAAREISGEATVVGTIDYMSPEQCEGLTDIDARADIYAMGVILHELVTGRSPFWGPRAVVREKHLSHRPPRLAAGAPELAIPPALEEIAARCLAKDRSARFPGARDLLRALQSVRASLETMDVTPVPSSRAPMRMGTEAARLTCGVVFFETTAAPNVVQTQLRAVGGQIAHGVAGRYAAVFVQDLSDNPAQRALIAARRLVRNGLCARARVDLAMVTAQTRKDGTRRFLNPQLAQADRYPAAGDAEIVVSQAAAEVLPDGDPDDPPTSVGGEIRAGSTMAGSWPMVGRDDVLAALVDSALDTTRNARPAVVTVTGDAGTGKSHLFREVATRLAALEPQVTLLALRAREPALGDVDPTLTELVRCGLSAAPSREPVTEEDAAQSQVLAAVLAQGSARSEEGISAQPAFRSLGAAPGALRSAMTAATGDVLRRKASARPLLVLIDDAHFVGDIALAALEYAALGEAGAPIWVCAFGRSVLVQDHPAWGERAGRRESHTLGPLDASSAAQLCRKLLLPVETVPGPAVAHLVARAAATPLLLVELVRGLHREGIVRRSPKGESWYLATDELDRLPDLPVVEWMAHREIAGLAPALRDHARLIALLGDGTTQAEIEGVVRRIDDEGGGLDFPLDAGVATRRLLATGSITRDAQGRVSYRQALVRQALARDTSETFRRVVHQAAAAFYRGADAMPDQRRLSQLAIHASAAGLGQEAVRTYMTLAERAHTWHAYLEAERLYSRVLEQPGVDASDRAAAHRGRGLMRYRLSRYHDALADFAVARDRAEEVGDTMTALDILLDEATVLDWMDDHATSELRVREAEERTPSDAPPLFRARLHLGMGRSAMRLNWNTEASDLLERAAAAAAPLGDDGYETQVIALVLLSYLLLPLGRPADVHRVLEQLVVLCEAHGDKLHLGAALNARALLWGSTGDRGRMTVDMDRSLALARELGQGSLELNGEYNIGEYLLLMDDPTAAAPYIARARALDLRITGHPGRAVVALLDARLRLHMGDLAGAAAIVQDIREHQAAMRARGENDRLMVPSEDVLCSAIELSTAGASLEQWDELEARSEQCSVGQERIEILDFRAAASQRANRVTEAHAHVTRAIELTSRIPNVMQGRLARRLTELARLV
jgi:tetratricopeptide (TPR) repeat protein